MRAYTLPSGPWYRPPRPHRRDIAPWRALAEGGSLRAVDPRLGAYHVSVQPLGCGARFVLYRGREPVVIAGCGWSGCGGWWIVEPMAAGLRAAGAKVGPIALLRPPWLVLAPGAELQYAPRRWTPGNGCSRGWWRLRGRCAGRASDRGRSKQADASETARVAGSAVWRRVARPRGFIYRSSRWRAPLLTHLPRSLCPV